MELRGLEPLTPTLPVWCATSCAIAPYFTAALFCGCSNEVTPWPHTATNPLLGQEMFGQPIDSIQDESRRASTT